MSCIRLLQASSLSPTTPRKPALFLDDGLPASGHSDPAPASFLTTWETRLWLAVSHVRLPHILAGILNPALPKSVPTRCGWCWPELVSWGQDRGRVLEIQRRVCGKAGMFLGSNNSCSTASPGFPAFAMMSQTSASPPFTLAVAAILIWGVVTQQARSFSLFPFPPPTPTFEAPVQK